MGYVTKKSALVCLCDGNERYDKRKSIQETEKMFAIGLGNHYKKAWYYFYIRETPKIRGVYDIQGILKQGVSLQGLKNACNQNISFYNFCTAIPT